MPAVIVAALCALAGGASWAADKYIEDIPVAGPHQKVETRRNEAGEPVEVVFYDYNVDPPQVEKLTIDRKKNERVRTTFRANKILRKETERYAHHQDLREREVLTASHEGGKLDHKTIVRYGKGGEVATEEYSLAPNGAWKKLLAK